MARDPFAPVPQSSVPKWVWIVVGMVGLVIVGVISTVALVLSRRPQAVVTAPVVAPASPETPAAGAATQPQAPAGDKTAAAAGTDSKPDADEGGDKAEKKKKHGGSKHAAKHEAKKPAAPSAPSAPPKPKTNMSQKDIDKLLGI